MNPDNLTVRVENLEKRMALLEELPERVAGLEAHVAGLELQFLQFRAEVGDGFSALRGEMRLGEEETRKTLRDEIRAGDEETRRLMRVLHEEVLERIALIGEGGPPGLAE